ncbi:hypothetical protein CCACVL1_08126 [Corchorus capsularis]|uniref:Uncharacterized protein n=1 Tax=Corchorus capsularis TaxID=210143 RepID=A0A1R3J241_COCAP|nr:hypothetical protein CCACVL1_08126 [Corchorus capsularis]
MVLIEAGPNSPLRLSYMAK